MVKLDVRYASSSDKLLLSDKQAQMNASCMYIRWLSSRAMDIFASNLDKYEASRFQISMPLLLQIFFAIIADVEKSPW